MIIQSDIEIATQLARRVVAQYPLPAGKRVKLWRPTVNLCQWSATVQALGSFFANTRVLLVDYVSQILLPPEHAACAVVPYDVLVFSDFKNVDMPEGELIDIIVS